MQRYVKNIREYLTEALSQSEWLNYKADTMMASNDPDEDLKQTAAELMRLLNVADPAMLLFTGEDVTTGEDYKYFLEKVIPQSDESQKGSVPHSDYTEYYTLYNYKGSFFVKMDIKESYEYSYIFIREEDYEKFDKIDPPLVPPAQKKPAEAPGSTMGNAQGAAGEKPPVGGGEGGGAGTIV